MTTSATSPAARRSLRTFASPHALSFSSRLLRHSKDGMLTFREFLTTAREFVEHEPERSAMYLAALVALDLGATVDAEAAPNRPTPSTN